MHDRPLNFKIYIIYDISNDLACHPWDPMNYRILFAYQLWSLYIYLGRNSKRMGLFGLISLQSAKNDHTIKWDRFIRDKMR